MLYSLRANARVLLALLACLCLVVACGGGDKHGGGGNKGTKDGGGTGGASAGGSDAGGGMGGAGGSGGTGGATTGGAGGTVGDAQAGSGGVMDASTDASSDSGDADSGSPCDDGNPCTNDVLRTNGSCVNVPIVCAAVDQCHNAGICDPATGQCSTPNKTDGTACNDNDVCTQTDTCQAGVCTGSNPIVCQALDQCHDAGTCDPTTGLCSDPVKVDGSTCDDGNLCTQTDTCQSGACTGSNPIACTALDPCHDPGICNPSTGVCSNPNKPNGAACDDANLCTQSDTCQAGVCTGANPINCSSQDECHNPGTCDPATGFCSSPSAPNGATCDDGNACTQADTCQGGVCTGANPVVCTASDQCHDVGTCDTVTGQCSNPAKANGSSCDDGNACTQTDSCQSGTCAGLNPVVCTAMDQCHVAGTCNSSTGVCSNPPKVDGAVCNDADACTQTDTCQSGICTGFNPVTCSALDQCHLVGACDPGTGQCTNPPKQDGATCTDSNACTLLDTCQAGTCTGSNPVVCNPQDQCHDAGSCNPATGQCTNPAKSDGTACNDANACTQTDACLSGNCVGSSPVTCTASDQCHSAGTCDPATGTCTNPTLPNGTVCDDANACTTTDTCQGGACTGANPVNCLPSDQCHQAGTCDPATGVCSNPPKPDGTNCNDNNLCTTPDACQAGTCTGTVAVTCTAQDNCHDVGTCDPATGVCSNPELADDTPCDDNDLCSSGDACRSGVCTGSTFVQCTAQDNCHDAGICDATTGLCTNPTKPDGTVCDDASLCTSGETCVSGACTPATSITCSALDGCHDPGTCDPATGFCSNPTKADGASCDDGDACTQTDACSGGNCLGSNPKTCTALDQCHDPGTCDPLTGTCSNPNKANGTSCDDGSLCTNTDTCQLGTCTGSNPVVCTALDQCHNAGACNPATGTCSNPNKSNGASCDDGNACTLSDSCQTGSCVGGAAVACTASDQCHDPGTCDPATGFCSDPEKSDGTSCNDGNGCTQTDTCVSGTCTGSNPKTCTALDQCHTAGTCNAATGTCSNPAKANGTTCNDGNLCTQTDACQSGSCTGSNPKTCAASDQCHDAGTCDPATGNCSNPAKADSTPCNDGLVCTTSDVCMGGTCTGGPPPTCDDGIACTADSCVEPSGCTVDTTPCLCFTNADCNDADACNGVYTCDASGACVEVTPPVDCSGLNDACNVGVCNPADGTCNPQPLGDGLPCDDGDACTTTDECVFGGCVGTNPITCTAIDQCHDAGTCNPLTGTCSTPNKTNGAPCNDGSQCTLSDSCQSGTCTGSNPIVCTALDQCHNAGTCDPTNGTCDNPTKANGSSCNDGNGCTQTDTCQLGACVGSNPKTCTALDQCHSAGTCDSATGNCTNPAKADGTSCDDGSLCTLNDACQAGSCVATANVTCTAIDQCHNQGTCDPGTGVCSNPPKNNGSSCEDGNLCTTADTCQNGSCASGSPKSCTASDQCHVAGTCDPATGNCSNPLQANGVPCNDGLACTANDQCVNGSCVGPDPTACPSQQCKTGGTCNEAMGGCVYLNLADGTACDDGDFCTTDVCQSGSCVGTTFNKCNYSSTPAIAGCDPCIDQVCAADSYCCNNGWDGLCVDEVRTVCGSIECSCGTPNYPQCNAPQETPATCPSDCCYDVTFAPASDALPQSLSGSTSGFPDRFAPYCGANGASDMIISFTAPTQGMYTFDTVSPSTNYNTVLALSFSCGDGGFVCSDDYITGSTGSLVQYNMYTGQTLNVVVDGAGGQSGSFALNVNLCGDGVCYPLSENKNNCYDCRCGDGICDSAEDMASCPQDCGSICGDSICSPEVGEYNNSCPECGSCTDGFCGLDEWWLGCAPGGTDCSVCGDGTCSYYFEGPGGTCPEDCPMCGDGKCTGGETADPALPWACPVDCTCGNGVCDPGESPSTCPDCACGDGICSQNEYYNCWQDCYCGDGVCEKDYEDRSWCNDCRCGDGVCDNQEQALIGKPGGCPVDCTACAHSPCDTGVALDSSCDPSVNYICSFVNSDCCKRAWDQVCTYQLEYYYGMICQ